MNKINNLETDPDVLKILIPYMISIIAEINVWGQCSQQRALGQTVVMERESCTLLKLSQSRTTVVVQWLRIFLPMQGTPVRSLVQKDFTGWGPTKHTGHNYRACVCFTTREATTRRSPSTATREQLSLTAPGESPYAATMTQCSQKVSDFKRVKQEFGNLQQMW